MIDDSDRVTENLEPWVILQESEPACWKLQDGRIALALFSRQEVAQRYADQHSPYGPTLMQPKASELVRIMVACVESEVILAALDPDGETTKQVFDIPDILKKVREDLRAGKPLIF